MLPFKLTLSNPSNPALTPGAFAQQQARHEMLRKTKLAKMAEEAAAVAKLYGALVESFATLDPEEDPDDPDAIDRFVAPFVEKGRGWTFEAPCPVDLLRSCSNGGRCALGRDKPLGMFQPQKPKARVAFEAALASYHVARADVEAAKGIRGRKGGDALKVAERALSLSVKAIDEARPKTCQRCRDKQRCNELNPNKEVALRKELLAVYKKRKCGSVCLGGHCGGYVFDDHTISAELDHEGNAEFKKTHADGKKISGPSSVASFTDLIDMWIDILLCQPKCRFCHRIDTVEEQRAQAAEDVENGITQITQRAKDHAARRAEKLAFRSSSMRSSTPPTTAAASCAASASSGAWSPPSSSPTSSARRT